MMKYLVFDSAINGVYTLIQLQKKYPTHVNLFKDKEADSLWNVAPWIFEMDEYDYNDGWNGEHDHILISLKRCLVIETPVKLNSLNGHLQQFIYKTIEGRIHYNRFWDAKVLQQQLAKFDTKQLLDFFEEIECLYIEDENRDQLQKYFLDKRDRIAIQPISKEVLFTGSKKESKSTKDIEGKKEETEMKDKPKLEEKPKTRRFFTN